MTGGKRGRRGSASRRDFLKASVLVGGAAGLGWVPEGGAESTLGGRSAQPGGEGGGHPPAPRRLRILILGGTSFIGPHQVRYALDRGHEITLFNRGQTNPHLFPEVEKLRGDRNGDLKSLEGRSWDVCIDNSASTPEWVTLSASLLRDAVGIYMYVSSRSAYADFSAVPMTAAHPTHTYETAGVQPGSPNLPYGLRKALCEREVMRFFPDRYTIFRPALIVGPGDLTDRFTYWPVRIHRGGEILAPGDPSDPCQIIDARDLSEWMIRMAEEGHTGIYNALGPAIPRPMDQLLYGIRAVTTAEAFFTWVPADFLAAHNVRSYTDMPVWSPPGPGREGFARFDISPEVAKGLRFRPLAVTAVDTLEYYFSRPEEERAALRAGLEPDREAQVLKAWREARGSRP